MREVRRENLSNEMQTVLQCIDNINPRYYVEPVTALQNRQIIDRNGFRANESTFVSQLFAATQTALHGQDLYLEMFFQTNAPKQVIFQQQDYQTKYSHSFESLFNPNDEEHEEFYKIPDIVIHGGPENFEAANQIFISEVKTSLTLSQKLFDIDLFKLNVYHDDLDFQNSAFIIVNQSVDNIERKLMQYRRQRFFQSNREGLYIVIKQSASPEHRAIAYEQ